MEDETPAHWVLHVWSGIPRYEAKGDRESVVGKPCCHVFEGQSLVTEKCSWCADPPFREGSGHGFTGPRSDYLPFVVAVVGERSHDIPPFVSGVGDGA